MAESFFDRIKALGTESRQDLIKAEINKPPAVLDDVYGEFVSELPGEVRLEVDRYLDIFKNDPTPVLKFLDEYKEKGSSDYFNKSVSDLSDIADDKDLTRFSDFKVFGPTRYDMIYRPESESGKQNMQKMMEGKVFQLAAGPTHGLYTGVRGTAELFAALSDLYLDTETLDNVKKALPEI